MLFKIEVRKIVTEQFFATVEIEAPYYASNEALEKLVEDYMSQHNPNWEDRGCSHCGEEISMVSFKSGDEL